MKVLVTGAAGFIGFHVCQRLLSQGYQVVGLDNINDYYPRKLKLDRLKLLGVDSGQLEQPEYQVTKGQNGFKFIYGDLVDKAKLDQLFRDEKIDGLIHLAAQAGVRYSISHPEKYIESNLIGFFNILESCRHFPVKHLVYASSSSVYGLNRQIPFSVADSTAHPISLYAATKRSNEAMAHSYSYLYDIPVTGIRFFTVYGPYGRPDMAAYLFTNAISKEEPIRLFNHGNMVRDFTYVDDVCAGVCEVLTLPPAKSDLLKDGQNLPSEGSVAPYRLLNIGNKNPVKLMDFVRIIEKEVGKPAKLNMEPMQPGDVEMTFADMSHFERLTGMEPKVDIEEGLKRYVKWFLGYYS